MIVNNENEDMEFKRYEKIEDLIDQIVRDFVEDEKSEYIKCFAITDISFGKYKNEIEAKSELDPIEILKSFFFQSGIRTGMNKFIDLLKSGKIDMIKIEKDKIKKESDRYGHN